MITFTITVKGQADGVVDIKATSPTNPTTTDKEYIYAHMISDELYLIMERRSLTLLVSHSSN